MTGQLAQMPAAVQQLFTRCPANPLLTDQLRLYYGAADSTIALATATLSDVLAYTLACPEPDPTRMW